MQEQICPVLGPPIMVLVYPSKWEAVMVDGRTLQMDGSPPRRKLPRNLEARENGPQPLGWQTGPIPTQAE